MTDSIPAQDVKSIRIVSDGTAFGTQILNHDGTPIPGVIRLEIMPLEADGLVEARLTFHCVKLDVMAKTDGDDVAMTT